MNEQKAAAVELTKEEVQELRKNRTAKIGVDANIPAEQREACYAAWSEYRDAEEAEGECADICDFRAGFLYGYEAAPTAQLAAMRAALEHYADERNWQRLSRPTTVANVLIRGGNGYDIAQAALASPSDKKEDK